MGENKISINVVKVVCASVIVVLLSCIVCGELAATDPYETNIRFTILSSTLSESEDGRVDYSIVDDSIMFPDVTKSRDVMVILEEKLEKIREKMQGILVGKGFDLDRVNRFKRFDVLASVHDIPVRVPYEAIRIRDYGLDKVMQVAQLGILGLIYDDIRLDMMI